MNLYIITVEWIYEEGESIVGVCDKEHIDSMIAEYKSRYDDAVVSSIRRFSIDEYILNKSY